MDRTWLFTGPRGPVAAAEAGVASAPANRMKAPAVLDTPTNRIL
jgi:hypothetical protein